jgi:pyrroline-5-carboxylate reductase
MNIGFIGTGNMATAIIKGILHANTVEAENIFAFDIDGAKLELFAEKYGINPVASAQALVETCPVVFIAVKPANFPDLLKQLDESIKANDPMMISMAAGTSLDYITSLLSCSPALVRIMPNINATVGESMTAYCTNGKPDADQIKLVEQLCTSFGNVMALDEKYFPIFSVIAGAAPAFSYMFIDELARAAVKLGMNKKQALQIAAQTVLGSAKLVLDSDEHPYELIDRVCSPGGITIEGVTALQEFGFPNAINQAVEKAYLKDSKLGGQNKKN